MQQIGCLMIFNSSKHADMTTTYITYTNSTNSEIKRKFHSTNPNSGHNQATPGSEITNSVIHSVHYFHIENSMIGTGKCT